MVVHQLSHMGPHRFILMGRISVDASMNSEY